MKKHSEYIKIYHEYFPYVYNTIYARIGNIHEAEDLCQEIFTHLYNKFDEVENPRKWLFGTMRNTLLKFYRDKKSNIDIDSVFDDMSLTFANAFKDTRLLLKDILEQIIESDEEQMLIDLIAVHNYSYQYVSKIMGITYKTVLYRYNKIVQKVTAKLKEKGIFSLEDLL